MPSAWRKSWWYGTTMAVMSDCHAPMQESVIALILGRSQSAAVADLPAMLQHRLQHVSHANARQVIAVKVSMPWLDCVPCRELLCVHPTTEQVSDVQIARELRRELHFVSAADPRLAGEPQDTPLLQTVRIATPGRSYMAPSLQLAPQNSCACAQLSVAVKTAGTRLLRSRPISKP